MLSWLQFIEAVMLGKDVDRPAPPEDIDDEGGGHCPCDRNVIREWLYGGWFDFGKPGFTGLKTGGWREIGKNMLEYTMQGEHFYHITPHAIIDNNNNIAQFCIVPSYIIRKGDGLFEKFVKELKKELIDCSLWKKLKLNTSAIWSCISDEEFIGNIITILGEIRGQEMKAFIIQHGINEKIAQAEIMELIKSEDFRYQPIEIVKWLGVDLKGTFPNGNPAFYAAGNSHPEQILMAVVVPYKAKIKIAE